MITSLLHTAHVHSSAHWQISRYYFLGYSSVVHLKLQSEYVKLGGIQLRSKHSQFDCHWTFMWSVWYDNNLLFAFLWFDIVEAVKTDCALSAQEIPWSWRKIECFQSADKHIWAMKLNLATRSRERSFDVLVVIHGLKPRYSLWKEAMDWSQRGLSWRDVLFPAGGEEMAFEESTSHLKNLWEDSLNVLTLTSKTPYRQACIPNFAINPQWKPVCTWCRWWSMCRDHRNFYFISDRIEDRSTRRELASEACLDAKIW